LLGCVLLWSLRPLTETRSTLIGWSIAMVYPSIGIVAEIYYQYFYYPTAAPFDRLFWPGIAYQFLIGGSGGALAGILRWISIDPIRNRLVTQGRAAYRAILWWLALLPMSALLIHILAAIRVVPYWFYYTTSSLDVLLFGALLTGWVAGTRAAKPTQRAWFSAGGLSLLSIALVISKHPTPLNLLFVWVVWNLGLNASTKVFETSPERRTTAAEKAVFIFSVPSIFLPALLFIPIAGFLIFYFGTGLFYLSSLLALLIAVFALMSKIPLWPKIANLLLAASSISFSFLLSEALRRVF
jgi:hypothetical protein